MELSPSMPGAAGAPAPRDGNLIAPPDGWFGPDVRVATTTRAFAAAAADRLEVAARLARRLVGHDAAWAGGRQCHADAVACVEERDALPRLVDATDALVTRRRGVVLCCFTADCVPVVVADAPAGIIGVAHAGWRGTRARIAHRLVAALLDRGAAVDRVKAWIGPAISGPAYEVSEELAAEFAAAFPREAPDVVAGRHLDLPRLNALQLATAGLAPRAIASSGVCTFRDVARCFSYRRDGSCGAHLVTGVALAAP